MKGASARPQVVTDQVMSLDSTTIIAGEQVVFIELLASCLKQWNSPHNAVNCPLKLSFMFLIQILRKCCFNVEIWNVGRTFNVVISISRDTDLTITYTCMLRNSKQA